MRLRASMGVGSWAGWVGAWRVPVCLSVCVPACAQAIERYTTARASFLSEEEELCK
jgi:hypothetical protein